MTDQSHLHQLLEQLHAELERTKSVDETGDELLRHLDADIRTLLQRSGKKLEKDEPMMGRLQETIDHFEATHPKLATALSEMMNILSNAGI